ncbi:type VI secretion system ATPase, ClpV1 family [Chitinispirillum alkaliphilum]|nr:type VI secretion system ATPase, ClpV1 family [Chitinispirillum alkaliphilum]
MVVSDIRIILDKLNDHCQKAFQSSVGSCVNKQNYELTYEHLFYALTDSVDNDIALICRHFGIDIARLKKMLVLEIENFPTGSSSKPTFSPSLVSLLEKSWSIGTLRYGCEKIRSGVVFTAAYEDITRSISPVAGILNEIDENVLKKDLLEIIDGSSESCQESSTNAQGQEAGNNEILKKYCKNLTLEAREGKIDPILGRDSEIFQVVDILSRRRKNNPILVGDAGVGKTAIIEGLAQQIVSTDVPDSLKDVEVWELDLGLLQAGASVKGEFEKRLKEVIDIAKKSGGRIILFIDEAHTLIGAGGSAGVGDAANLLKPALARGELRTCAATTWLEYRKYFEKDPALTRRFQLVKVEEPDEEKACAMLRGIAPTYEKHHGVHISEEGIKAAVHFSKRFISGRQLPDKAVDILDTASTRVKMSRTTTPSCIESKKKKLADIHRALQTIKNDSAAGIEIDQNEIERLDSLTQTISQDVDNLMQKWEKERACVEEIVELHQKARDAGRDSEQSKEIQLLLESKNRELESIAGENPLVYSHVSGDICAKVIADWTGIPVGSIMKDEAKVLLKLEQKLSEKVKGQDCAISEIASAIRSSKVGMKNPDAPLGVFLCTGPSGVGKTECALALAETLFGGEKFSTVINMSEYQEKHTVSQLKGSPPGYVGYGEGGILTEAVRQKPYSIVILDEVEKAHKDILNMFYQVFDKGFMRDGEGRDINFRNTVILMTSNLGSETILQAQTQQISDQSMLIEMVRPELTEHFGAALLARCNIIPFMSLTPEVLDSVIRMKLGKIETRLMENHSMSCSYSDDVVKFIANRCCAAEAGARNIDAVINSVLLPAISDHILSNVGIEEGESEERKVVIDIDETGDVVIEFGEQAVVC